MKKEGWVKLWREQFNNEVLKNKSYCEGYAWCWLYSHANSKKESVNFRNQYIDVKRGEIVTSKLKLARQFCWTQRRVSVFLDALERNGMITYRTTNRFTHIFILNYAKYQDIKKQKYKQIKQQTAEQVQTNKIYSTNNANKNKTKDTNANNNIYNASKNNLQRVCSTDTTEIVEIIDIFKKKINPTINFGNRTTRKATKDLLKIYGFKRLKEITEYAISVQGQKFAPVITTPYQLKEKLASLRIFQDRDNAV